MEQGYAKYQIDRGFWRDPIPFGDLSLVQIGRLHLKPTGEVAVHTHLNWFELTVVTDGAGAVETNGTSVPVSRGDIVLSFPGDFHAVTSDPEKPLKFDYIAFWAEEGKLRDDLFAVTRRFPSAESRLFRDERIDRLLLDALAEIDGGDEYSAGIVAAALKHIVFRVLRDFGDIPPAERSVGGASGEELAYRMMRYIDTHVFSMTGLSSLSDEMRYHYSYLSEVFRRATGDTLQHYYRTRRLEAARLLLAEGKMTVAEVAERLGYASVYSFSRSFKTEFGVPPSRVKPGEK